MSFQNPTFLWALLLLAIPLIIHLYNFRQYKKVIFSNLAMLKEIQTQSSKTRQIKKWLILATRMLALACLILAFALPFLPSNVTQSGRQLVSIYIDNSESMRADGENGQLFENAKTTAREIIQNLSPDAEIQILNNDLSPYASQVHTPENAIKLVDDMAISYYPNDFSKIVQKISTKYNNEGYASQHTFAISDFQQRKKDEQSKIDSNLSLHIIKTLPENFQNISIDSVWLEEPVVKPQSPIKLRVKVVNNGDEVIESSTLVLKINGVQQGVESFGLQSKETKIIDVAFSSSQKGWIEGDVSVNDVPVVFDNVYHFALQLKPNINILQIGEASIAIAKIFKNDPIFKLTTALEGSVDYASFAKFDFIIINELHEIGSGLSEQLKQFAEKGGVVAIIPAKQIGNYSAVNSILGMASYGMMVKKGITIKPEDLKQPFIKDVYKKIPKNSVLPKVIECYNLQVSGVSQALFSLKDNSPVLLRGRLGAGSVFQFAMPMDKAYSNMAQHELFVLSMLKMSFSRLEKQQLAYPMFGTSAIPIEGLSTAENTLSLVSPTKSVLVESALNKGGYRFWLNNELNEAGVYSLRDKNKIEQAKVALNVSRQESIQRYATKEDLNDSWGGAKLDFMTTASASIKNVTGKLQSGTPLWKLFVLLCLIFLLIEILLLRFLKS
jgi:hypothetical protein